MKILLVTLPYYRFCGSRTEWVGVGPLYAAQDLRKYGHEVKVLNGDLDHKPPLSFRAFMRSGLTYYARAHNAMDPIYLEIAEKVDAFAPDVVGLSVNEGQQVQASLLAMHLRKYPVLLGGPLITLRSDEFLMSPHLTFAGEAEGGRLARYLAATLRQEYPYPAPNGPVDLDALDPLTPDLMLDPIASPLEFNQFSTSRGCGWDCTFCSSKLLWPKVRYQSIEKFVRDLDVRKALVPNLELIQMVDDTFLSRKERTLDLAEEIAGRDLRFVCDARCEQVTDYRFVQRLQERGCVQVKLGVEAGTQRMLDAFGKRQELATAQKAVAMCQDAGIQVAVYVILGAPGGTDEEYQASLKFMESLRADWYSVSVLYPFRGTKLGESVSLPAHLADGNVSVLDPALRKFWGVSDATWERAIRLNDGKMWIREE